MPRFTGGAALCAATCAAGVVGSAVAHARAAQPAPVKSDNTAVVVLGFPSRTNGRSHPIQHWRARLTVLTVNAHEPTIVIFTGAGSGGSVSQARLVADLAIGLGLDEELVVLEEQSSNTWENIEEAAPLLGDADQVIIVSDPLHAARARRYWLKQRPEDHERVCATDRSSFWDEWSLKVPTALDAAIKAGRGFVFETAEERSDLFWPTLNGETVQSR